MINIAININIIIVLREMKEAGVGIAEIERDS